MVAKTPTKEKRMMAASINPNLVRETVKKVDRCVARLQELQYTLAGGSKVVSGVNLSPRSTRGYLRTSLICKQESIKMKNATARRSPPGKMPINTNGDWRRMSLPANLLGETVVEILQASQFAKEVVASAAQLPKAKALANPKTPDTAHRNKKPRTDGTELRARRTTEKQRLLRTMRSECGSPVLPRARSRIAFKSNSPLNIRDGKNAAGPSVTAHRVSPRNRPWAKKTVLFPNPLFISSSSTSPLSHQPKFYKTRSPIISRARQQTPHKFVVKSPSTTLKQQLKSKKAVPATSDSSPTGRTSMPMPRRCSFSPSKLATRLVSPLKSKMASPLKSRISVQRSNSGLISGLKQRPNFNAPVRLSTVRMI